MSTSSGPQIEVALHSIFASRKRNPVEEEKQVQSAAMLPGNFQVYAKIDEESRKDSTLVAAFLLTLNDARGSVTYEFRGSCSIRGSSADFESVMEAHKESRIPRILDIIYQRLYPVVFILAGMTSSSYPQSIALLTEMISSEPVQVHQEAEAIPVPHEEAEATSNPVEKPRIQVKPTMNQTAEIESSKPAMSKPVIPMTDEEPKIELPKPTMAKSVKPTTTYEEPEFDAPKPTMAKSVKPTTTYEEPEFDAPKPTMAKPTMAKSVKPTTTYEEPEFDAPKPTMAKPTMAKPTMAKFRRPPPTTSEES